MSYLTLPSARLADSAKGVISFWFRFSQDAIDAAKKNGDQPDTPLPAPTVMSRILPLLTFGRKVRAKVYDSEQFIAGQTVSYDAFGNPTPVYYSATRPILGGTFPVSPSFIGLYMDNDGAEERPPVPKISFNFQFDTTGDGGGYTSTIDSAVYTTAWELYISDASYVRLGQPETVSIDKGCTVSKDEWHHLLVSFDFSAGVRTQKQPNYDGDYWIGDSTSAFVKVWYALDDENRNGKDNMGQYWVEKDPNGLITANALNATGSYSTDPQPPTIHGAMPIPFFNWGGGGLPTRLGEIGTPASSSYQNFVCHVEMAELQVFTGISVNTDLKSIRRAFVDEDGKPVDPKESERVLSKRPDILLHGTNDWQEGKNTGAIGLTRGDPDTIIPSGQFRPTGGINKYTPDPSLVETPTA